MRHPIWYTQLRIKLTPTVEKWSDMGFVEVATPDDFFEIKGDSHIQGIICPLPKNWLADEFAVAAYSHAVQHHPKFIRNAYMSREDRSSRVSFSRKFRERGFNIKGTVRELLPPQLVEMERVLAAAYEKTTGEEPNSGIYQIDSNHHRVPATHEPTGIINLGGPTTIMFLQSARGRLVGKKSLPPQSMAVFVGCHAAPDTSLPRLNILCG